MFFWLGKAFNTLRYVIEATIRETLYNNTSFKNSKWGLIERQVVKWSQHYFYYVCLLYILAVFTSTNLILWEEKIAPSIHSALPLWNGIIDWQSGFLATQITIVGFIYPLVIGLVGILFQNKTAKKTLFPVYQIYSGFMFSGLSGLGLSIFIVLSFFIKSGVEEKYYAMLCGLSGIWLIFNLLLACWFFVVTLKVLTENEQRKLLLRFTIHEICEPDIRRRLKEVIQNNAIRDGLITKPEEKTLKLTNYSLNENATELLTVKNEAKLQINNINYKVFNTLILLQCFKIRVFKKLNNSASCEKNIPEIILEPSYKINEPSKFVILKGIGIDFNWFTKFLFRQVFTFNVVSNNQPMRLSEILVAQTGNAYDGFVA